MGFSLRGESSRRRVTELVNQPPHNTNAATRQQAIRNYVHTEYHTDHARFHNQWMDARRRDDAAREERRSNRERE